jgi:hypothetical protein
MGDGLIFPTKKNIRASLYRMCLISAGSISLDSTFKADILDFNKISTLESFGVGFSFLALSGVSLLARLEPDSLDIFSRLQAI